MWKHKSCVLVEKIFPLDQVERNGLGRFHILTKCSSGSKDEERGTFSRAECVLREPVALLQKYIRNEHFGRKNTLFKGQHGHRSMGALASHE